MKPNNTNNKMKEKLLNFMFPVGGGTMGAIMTEATETLEMILSVAIAATTSFLVYRFWNYIWKKLFKKRS